MNFPVAALLLAASAALVGATATPTPVPAPVEAPAPAARPPPPPGDYTSRSMEPALAPEFDPAQALPPPAYAEPSDEDGLRECVTSYFCISRKYWAEWRAVFRRGS